MISQHPYPSRQTEPPFPPHPTLRRNLLELLSHGIEVDLVCITPDWCLGRHSAEHPGLRLYGMPQRKRRFPAIWYVVQYAAFLLWACLVVSALALRRHYDVVQVDTIPDVLVFSALVPRLRGIPIVLYVYDLMPEMTAARLRLGHRDVRVRLVAWLERAATGWADRVITVTDLFRRIMATRGLDPRRVALVANSHPFGQLPRWVPPPAPILIVQTTLIERYGVHIAIRALAELRKDWPDLTLHLLGDGEARPKLIALAEQLGVRQRVVFSPFLPWPEAMERVRRATVGIVPIIAEGYGDLILPNKVFEFASMEIPFACSRLRGIEEHLPPDAVAYFEPGDAAGLAAQLHRLLSDPEAARRQAARAKQAMADLAWEHASRRYLQALGFVPEPEPARFSVAH